MRAIAICAVAALSFIVPIGNAAAGGAVHSGSGTSAVGAVPGYPLGVRPAAARYGAVPLGFEPNRGQAPRAVRYLAHGPGYTLFLTNRSATLVLTSRPSATRTGRVTAALRLTPSGGRSSHPIATGHLPGTVSYFIGKNPARWHTDIPTFARITYRGIYHGIDLAFYGTQGSLEYDWVVHPGANPNRIRLALEGGSHLRLDSAGDLLLRSGHMLLQQSRPRIYQSAGRETRSISGGYSLIGGNQIGFRLDRYDPSRSLIIDPTIASSTYLGGSAADTGSSIAVDSAGDAYVAGTTYSANFPATKTIGPANKNGATSDAFVTKLNPSGTALLFSAWLGGSGSDYGEGIAVDGTTDGYTYVGGYTTSTDFPTTPNGLQTVAPNEAVNGFAVAINTIGVPTLVYGSYIGGTTTIANGTEVYGVSADSGKNMYLTGTTYATTLPVIHAFQPNQGTLGNNYQDAFLIRINVTVANGPGTEIYGTYFGAPKDTGAFAVSTDGSSTAIITGYSTGGIVTREPYQATFGGGNTDAFLAAFDTNAFDDASLVYSSYFGGTGDESGRGVAADTSGNAYITGVTTSADLPETTSPSLSPHANRGTGCPGTFAPPCSDAFVANFHFSSGNALTLAYSDYLGGSDADVGTSIAIDSFGDAYVGGYTVSLDYPIANALPGQNSYNGGQHDAFISVLSAAGDQFIYSTYLGGGGDDEANGIAVLATDTFVTGYTTSANFPDTAPVALSPHANRGTGTDAFITRLAHAFPSIDFGLAQGLAACTFTGAGTPSCFVHPVSACGVGVSCQAAMTVTADCATPPTTLSCGQATGRLGQIPFRITFASGGTSGSGGEGGYTTDYGYGFYGRPPYPRPVPNANFRFDGTDDDSASQTDTFDLLITPANGATFAPVSAHWTCHPAAGFCTLEVTAS